MQAPLSKQQVLRAEPASTERRCEKEGTPTFWGQPQDYGTGPERDGRNAGPESCLRKNRPAPGHLLVCPPPSLTVDSAASEAAHSGRKGLPGRLQHHCRELYIGV